MAVAVPPPARCPPRYPQRLLLPGGPGLGSASLAGLADLMDVGGDVWLVDLPGDGSNVDPPGAVPDPNRGWPSVLLEAAQAVSEPLLLRHSTGGMYILSVPELEPLLRGVVLVSSAPIRPGCRDTS